MLSIALGISLLELNQYTMYQLFDSVERFMDEYNKHTPLSLEYILKIDKDVRDSVEKLYN